MHLITTICLSGSEHEKMETFFCATETSNFAAESAEPERALKPECQDPCSRELFGEQSHFLQLENAKKLRNH